MRRKRFITTFSTALLGLLILGGTLLAGSGTASADSEGSFRSIPSGWYDSQAMTWDNQGGRIVDVWNGSPDYVTVDIWWQGQVILGGHRRIDPRQSTTTKDVFNTNNKGTLALYDITVTRWKNCTTTGCVIAGSYKYSGWTGANGWVPNSLWPYIPQP